MKKLIFLLAFMVGIVPILYAQTAAEVEVARNIAQQMGYSDAEITSMMTNYLGGQQQGGNTVQQQTTEGRQSQEAGNAEGEKGDKDTKEILRGAASGQGSIYGHSLFNSSASWTPTYKLPTPSDYVLGPDDELIIDLWGAVFTNIVKTVSSEGTIVLDNIGPVFLNGLTVEQAEKVLKKYLAKIYSGLGGKNPDTFMRLSLGRVKSVTVNVFGNVAAPGSHTVSSFSNIFSVLKVAGGVTNIGTVRNVKLIRNGKELDGVDLYGVLSAVGEYASFIKLQENDIIYVGTYESVVSISGSVKRPMKYEMKAGETLADLIEYAGGLTSGAYRQSIHIDRTNSTPVVGYDISFEDIGSFVLEDGDVVSVKRNQEYMANSLEIAGAVWNPGYYALSKDITTMSQLIKAAGGLLTTAYMDKALFFRLDPFTNRPIMMDVSVKDAISGVNDPVLMNGDALYICSYEDLLPNYQIEVKGEVKKPGKFIYGKNMTIADAILMAGGTTESATLANVEIARRVISRDGLTPPDSIAQILSFNILENPESMSFALHPYDIVFVRRIPGYRPQIVVTVTGEVNFPGSHVIEKKQVRLSDIIKKTGGFTNEAYLKGAKLSRQLTTEEYQRISKAREIAMQKLQASDNLDINIAAVSPDDRYNIVIDLEKAVNNPGSDADVVLRSGDVVSIPQIDYSVRISGGVQFPNVVSFNEKMKLKDYIDLAGGYVQRAKKSQVYVVHMNGEVQTKRGGSIKIRPGAEIVVPVKEPRRAVTAPEVLSIATSTSSLAMMVVSMVTLLTK